MKHDTGFFDSWKEVIALISCVGLILGFMSWLIYVMATNQPSHQQQNSDSDKARYIVVSYDHQGHVGQTLFCKEARKNEDKKEVVCTLAATDDIYILPYPVSIKNVTYTTDYLKYVNEK